MAQVHLEIPKSYTTTGREEDVYYTLPSSYNPSGDPHPLVVVWHGYGENPSGTANNSGFGAACETKGWIVACPLAFDQRHYSDLRAHEHVRLAVKYLIEETGLNIETKQIYHVHFSMVGGSTFVSKYLRIETGEYPAAGLICVCSGHDISDYINNHISKADGYLEIPSGMGGTFEDYPHRYQAASSIYMVDDSYVANKSMARNLGCGMPVYHCYSEEDTTNNNLVQNQQFKALMQFNGNPYEEDYHATGSHSWGLITPSDALDYVGDYDRDDLDLQDLYFIGDRSDKYHWITIALRRNNDFARIDIAATYSNNSIAISTAVNVTDLTLDLTVPSLKLTAANMAFSYTDSSTGAVDVVLTNIDTEPTAILQGGGSPFNDWSYDANADELTINRDSGETLFLTIQWS